MVKQDTVNNFVFNSNLKDSDTISYGDVIIKVNLNGEMLAENSFFTRESVSSSWIERKYFINEINDIQVLTDNSYREGKKFINSFRIQINDQKGSFLFSSHVPAGTKIGYSPLKIYLTAPPDSSQYYKFTVKITDDKGNIFTSTTVKVFVKK